LLAGANPDAKADVPGCAPALCISARDGHVDVASLLVEFGADVNATDDNFTSALSHAARHGHVSVMHLLTSRGAKVSSVRHGFFIYVFVDEWRQRAVNY
jgi:ankyrin repeat protein